MLTQLPTQEKPPRDLRRERRLWHDGTRQTPSMGCARCPDHGFDLLERPDRNRAEIGALAAEEFLSRFLDARIFGSNFLVENIGKKTGKSKKDKGIRV
jgi:hypothetical protein